MTASILKNKLHHYLEVADNKILKEFYHLHEAEIEESLSTNLLSAAQIEEVKRRREEYLSGNAVMYTWDEAMEMIGK